MSQLIDKDFSYYRLKDFESFAELINKCSIDESLVRLLPFLLRNLFENLLFYIFRDSLAPRHTNLFYNIHQKRSKDFSELINLLKVLKDDPEISKYHKNSVTDKTIEYLKKIREDGNLDVHRIVTEITLKYTTDKKSEINILLECLLSFYNAINGKKVLITDTTTHVKLARELNSSLPNQGSRFIINEIKLFTKEEIGDLLIEIESDKLIEVIEKIIAEIKLLENSVELEEKQHLYKIIEYSIIVRTDNEERKKILQKVADFIITEGFNYKTKPIFEKMSELLKIPVLKELFIENYIKDLIAIFCASKSYNEAEILVEVLFLLHSSIDKPNMDKIINSALKNRQIYEVSKVQSILRKLFTYRQEIFDLSKNRKLEKHNMNIPDWQIL